METDDFGAALVDVALLNADRPLAVFDCDLAGSVKTDGFPTAFPERFFHVAIADHNAVVLPAALPGIMGAVLMAASRAIGETMVVAIGAGAAAKLSLNPIEAMTTMTVKIVSQLTGDTEFASPETLVAFALGLTLFVMTLALNILALYIVRKYREQYE